MFLALERPDAILELNQTAKGIEWEIESKKYPSLCGSATSSMQLLEHIAKKIPVFFVRCNTGLVRSSETLARSTSFLVGFAYPHSSLPKKSTYTIDRTAAQICVR